MAHFYKYVTADTGKKILENGTLRWSAPAVLNDPFDMQFAFQAPADLDAVRAKVIAKYRQHVSGEWLDKPLNDLGRLIRSVHRPRNPETLAKFEEGLDRFVDEQLAKLARGMTAFNAEVMGEQFANARIFCFSETPLSILMWSYYAENHAGLILRFRDDTPDNPLTQAKPVRYVQQMPPLYSDDELSDLLAGYGSLTPQRIIDEVVWTKSSHWQHEREWRIYAGDGRTVALFEDRRFDASELDGVIFGLRMTIPTCAELAQIISGKYPHAKLLHMMPVNDRYELRIEDL
jgi:hypothetical protein